MTPLLQHDNFQAGSWSSGTRTCDDGTKIVTNNGLAAMPYVAGISGMNLCAGSATSEQRRCFFVDSSGSGTFVIEVEGASTAAITYSSNYTTLKNAIQAALDTKFGTNYVIVGGGSIGALTLTFSGGGYTGRAINGVAAIILSGSGFTIQGVTGVGAFISLQYGAFAGYNTNTYGADSGGAAFSEPLQEGLGVYVRLSVSPSTTAILYLSPAGGGGQCGIRVTNNDSNSIVFEQEGDGTLPAANLVATGLCCVAPALNPTTTTSLPQNDVELWVICRQKANDGTHYEIETWASSLQTGHRPVLIWKYGNFNQSYPGSNCTWRLLIPYNTPSGSTVLREVRFSPGSDGVPHPLIDPLQQTRQYYALLGNLGDLPLINGYQTKSGAIRGANYCYDTTRKYDLSVSFPQNGDPAYNGTGALYVNKNANPGSPWTKQLDGNGLNLFDIDATHQRPALLLAGPTNASVCIFPNDHGVMRLGLNLTGDPGLGIGGTVQQTIALSNNRPLASGRGLVTGSTTIDLNPANWQNYLAALESGSAIFVWWDGSAVQAAKGTISSLVDYTITLSSGTLTAITSGTTALPAAGTLLYISAASTDFLWDFWNGSLPASGWTMMPLCEASIGDWMLTNIAPTYCDSGHAADGLVLTKTDQASPGPMIRLGDGTILALACRNYTRDFYALRYRKLAPGADVATGWGAETRVFANETEVPYGRIDLGEPGNEVIGTWDFNPSGTTTANGFPVTRSSLGWYHFFDGTNWRMQASSPPTLDANCYATIDDALYSLEGYTGRGSITGSVFLGSQPSATTLLGGGPSFGAVQLPDGKVAVAYEADPNVCVTVLDTAQTYPAQTTGSDGLIVTLTGAEAEPSMTRLQDGSLLVLARTTGYAVMYRVTYAAGALAWDTTKGSSGVITCDGSNDGPLLIAGSSSLFVTTYGDKVLAFINQAGQGATSLSMNRAFLQVMECPQTAAFGGNGIENQWTQSAFSPVWDVVDNSGYMGSYSPMFYQQPDGSLRGVLAGGFGVFFTQFNTSQAAAGIATGGGGGGGSRLGIGL